MRGDVTHVDERVYGYGALRRRMEITSVGEEVKEKNKKEQNDCRDKWE